ncbi:MULTISPECIES: branched-chain amino acid ABC transporter permease [unclassified Haladaptatus]|uniref:branched-chain amino acid ABC transporter permease n=1 Tax=unclassified Haladaptatus TaxID=2622732 RepID=UPI00209C6950|nr:MULTISPECIES: branched-chain amino acid ABC transporter permease [unclassified Haladaptatus]MCO8245392.1 branched-chain amino acid ABC transporter permease [Haladaptatus sp. AB643]MCO8256829.1 branched-chain amino acid ABC transporter permease [Haladaptatus sp. AB618]
MVDADELDVDNPKRALSGVSRRSRRTLRRSVPERYRTVYGRTTSAIGNVLGIIVLIVAVYVLLRAAFYLVAPYVGVGIKTSQYTVMSRILQFVVLALAWDLIGGQTGYASFGNITFFGIGVYTVVVLMKGTLVGTYGFPVAFVAAGIVALVYALILGYPLLRLRGHYFAVATLGVLVATQQYVANLKQTGGGSGQTLPLPGFAQVDRTFFLLFVGLAVVTVIVYWYLMNTRFGYGLNAIRDDEAKARAMGIDTTKYKIVAWGVSALLTGFAGALFAYQNSYVSPGTAFNIDWTVLMILMALVGGMGRLWGPVLGAAFLWELRNTLWSGGPMVDAVGTITGVSMRNAYLVVFGIILVAIVIGAPNGILGYLEGKDVFGVTRRRVDKLRNRGTAGGEE